MHFNGIITKTVTVARAKHKLPVISTLKVIK